MATLDIAEFLTEQRQRLDRAREQLAKASEAAGEGEPLPPDVVRDGNRRELDDLRARLEHTEAARKQVAARYDAEIGRLRETIRRLEEEGKRIDEVLAGRPPRRTAGDGDETRAGRDAGGSPRPQPVRPEPARPEAAEAEPAAEAAEPESEQKKPAPKKPAPKKAASKKPAAKKKPAGKKTPAKPSTKAAKGKTEEAKGGTKAEAKAATKADEAKSGDSKK